MAIRCEDCGRENDQIYTKGPFVGSPKELDYCKHCSMDLCERCMAKPTGDENPDSDKHEVEEDE